MKSGCQSDQKNKSDKITFLHLSETGAGIYNYQSCKTCSEYRDKEKEWAKAENGQCQSSILCVLSNCKYQQWKEDNCNNHPESIKWQTTSVTNEHHQRKGRLIMKFKLLNILIYILICNKIPWVSIASVYDPHIQKEKNAYCSGFWDGYCQQYKNTE